MDRISAIRNIEDAIRAFEDGETDLAETERQVAAVLRTYATEFDGEDDVFRAVGDDPFDGTVVVAPSEPAARERIVDRAEPGGSAESVDRADGADGANRADGADGANRADGAEGADGANGADGADSTNATANTTADATFDVERL